MPTNAKRPIEVRETPTSDSQNDKVPKVSASGSPLENLGLRLVAVDFDQIGRHYRGPIASAPWRSVATVGVGFGEDPG